MNISIGDSCTFEQLPINSVFQFTEEDPRIDTETTFQKSAESHAWEVTGDMGKWEQGAAGRGCIDPKKIVRAIALPTQAD